MKSKQEKSLRLVDISRLKKFAFNNLPKDWPLREILLSENDELDVSVFLARLPVWLKLNRFSVGEDEKYTF